MVKKKNKAAVELGRRGGKNSRVNLTPEKRTALAQKAASARWGPRKAVAKRKRTVPKGER